MLLRNHLFPRSHRRYPIGWVGGNLYSLFILWGKMKDGDAKLGEYEGSNHGSFPSFNFSCGYNDVLHITLLTESLIVNMTTEGHSKHPHLHSLIRQHHHIFLCLHWWPIFVSGRHRFQHSVIEVAGAVFWVSRFLGRRWCYGIAPPVSPSTRSF